MVIDPYIIAVIVAAFGGALSSYLGWLGGTEKFDQRKFTYGVIRGAIGGIVLTVGLQLQGTPQEYVLLFLSAIGIDTAANKITPAVTQNQTPTPPKSP